MRRVHIKGNLQLFDKGYASGGFLADSKIDGVVTSGPQQQWFSRNSNWGKWEGGNWNMMFMGVPEAPDGSWPDKPFTRIDATPVIREKPFLIRGSKGYEVVIPSLKKNSAGAGWTGTRAGGKSIPLNEFYIAHPDLDNQETINKALHAGMNLLLTPGIYHLENSLRVTRKGTVKIGLGMPSLMPVKGTAAIEIPDVDGVSVCGITIDAGKVKSGNSRNVVVDHTWIWRADHGDGVGWEKNEEQIHHKVIVWLNGNKDSEVRSII